MNSLRSLCLQFNVLYACVCVCVCVCVLCVLCVCVCVCVCVCAHSPPFSLAFPLPPSFPPPPHPPPNAPSFCSNCILVAILTVCHMSA